MRLSKSRKILLTILLTCIMVVCIAFGAVSTAFAARTVTMTGSNFFYANDGAKIYAYEDVTDEDQDVYGTDGKPTGETTPVKKHYTMFYMTDGDDNVTYRYNLAYHWFAAQSDEESTASCSDTGDYSEGEEGWFSMVIGFNPSFVNEVCDNFDTITIAFQSQQYTKTEDSVTTNYITFVNNHETGADAGVYVIITDDEEETKVTLDDIDIEKEQLLHTVNGTQRTGEVNNENRAARITIEFTGYSEDEYDEEDNFVASHNGEYSVRVRSDYSSDAGGDSDDNDGGDQGEVSDGNDYEEQVTGYFKNVGGNYSKRVNSTTAGVMPLTFSATFDNANAKDDEKEDASDKGAVSDEADDEDTSGVTDETGEETEETDENLPNECGMILFSLNGQSFAYSDAESIDDSYYKNGTDVIISGTTVNDDAPPVLCLETNLKYLSYGQTLSFDYTVVDVLASSPKSEISYYVLTAEQYLDTSLDYNLVEDEEAGEEDANLTEEELDAKLKKSPFTLTTDDNRLLVETDIPYLPQETVEANKAASQEGGTGYTTECLAKVCILLTDITSSAGNNKTTYVMLDWYLSDTKVTIHDSDADREAGYTQADFIPVVKDSQGLSYGYFTDTAVEGSGKYSYNDVMSDYLSGKEELETIYSSYTYNFYDTTLAAEYQAEVDKLARDGQEYLLTAGSTSYFYLPEYNGFLGDNLDNYENLTFSIYYDVNGEQGSNTGLAYNALAISLGSEGKYTFTVYATDSSSNKMYYIDVSYDGSGNVNGYELKEFEGSDIYDDEDIMEMVPWFTFEVVYFGATIDDPETPSTGFVGTTYTDISFTINGISSYYETTYQLYEFDTAAYMEETRKTYYSYEEFAEDMEELFTSGETRKFFKEILNYADLNENDDKYDEMSEYEWDSDALSFIPQNSDAFYMVRLTVTDTRRNVGYETKSYLAIHVSAESSEFRGESDWARNNIVSIVLFCVAGVALIGIILVFAIRPKDQGDIDEQLSKQTEKAKAKAEKKKKK